MKSDGRIRPQSQVALIHVANLRLAAEGYRVIQFLADDVRRISSEHDFSDFSRRALNFQWL